MDIKLKPNAVNLLAKENGFVAYAYTICSSKNKIKMTLLVIVFNLHLAKTLK